MRRQVISIDFCKRAIDTGSGYTRRRRRCRHQNRQSSASSTVNISGGRIGNSYGRSRSLTQPESNLE